MRQVKSLSLAATWLYRQRIVASSSRQVPDSTAPSVLSIQRTRSKLSVRSSDKSIYTHRTSKTTILLTNASHLCINLSILPCQDSRFSSKAIMNSTLNEISLAISRLSCLRCLRQTRFQTSRKRLDLAVQQVWQCRSSAQLKDTSTLILSCIPTASFWTLTFKRRWAVVLILQLLFLALNSIDDLQTQVS